MIFPKDGGFNKIETTTVINDISPNHFPDPGLAKTQSQLNLGLNTKPVKSLKIRLLAALY